MSRRIRAALLALSLLTAWWLSLNILAQDQSALPIARGQSYVVMWGFFSEVLLVDEILADGWVKTRSVDPMNGRPGAHTWYVNTRQMLALTPFTLNLPQAD